METVLDIIKPLFPTGVETCCCRIEDCPNDLLPEERKSVAKAVPKRVQEFAAGRYCARQALHRLGLSQCALPRAENGVTHWPQGTVGAISHSNTWCGAVVGLKDDVEGIGLDIETIQRVSLSIARRVLTPEEARMIAEMPEDEARRFLCLIFSAKEAVYKCFFQLIKKRISFHDAIIIPQQGADRFKIRVSELIASRIPKAQNLMGSFFEFEGDIFAGIVLPR